jgi:hypothetical protein
MQNIHDVLRELVFGTDEQWASSEFRLKAWQVVGDYVNRCMWGIDEKRSIRVVHELHLVAHNHCIECGANISAGQPHEMDCSIGLIHAGIQRQRQRGTVH